MTVHTNVQGGGNSQPASHSVEQVHVQNVPAGLVDDVSSLSKTQGDNAKSERLKFISVLHAISNSLFAV